MHDEQQALPDKQTEATEDKPKVIPAEMPKLPPLGGRPWKKVLVMIISIVVLVWAGMWAYGRYVKSTNNSEVPTSSESSKTTNAAMLEGLQLDPNKNYGDKYASGVLPVGDEKFVTDGAKKGYVYMCSDNFVPDNQAGAQTRGPWFIGTTQWNINKKYSVQGSVKWQQSITNTISGDKRVITTNDLPDHVTGTFPVSSSDHAYAYDRNPNSIKSQSLTYNLSANPSYSSTPKCMGGEVGVLLTGVALFNAFDAGGRDAGAWEIQDGCQGHPQGSGIYHYHTLSSCIKDVGVGTVLGFALDGYPITGPKVGDKNYLTTDDLDDCHGIVSDITLDGKKVKMYHYVMTQDFPYSASCFRATAIQSPAQHTGGSQQQTGQQPSQSSSGGTMPPPGNAPGPPNLHP